MVQMRQSLPKKASLMRVGGGRHHDFTPSECISRGQSLYTGWWFVWWFIFAYIGIFHNPNWLSCSYFSEGWLNHQPVYHHVTICFHPLLPTRNEVSSATGSFRHSVGIGFPGSFPNRCSVMDEVRCKCSHDHCEWKSGKCKEKWCLPFNIAVS